MIPRLHIWLGRAALLATMAVLVGASGNCGFRREGALVPSYACNSTADCATAGTTCVEHVCAVASGSAYALVLQIAEPDVGFTAGPAIFTYDPITTLETGQRDLIFPTPHTVYGLVRFDPGTGAPSQSLEANLSFSRTSAVAGTFVDEIRAATPTAYVNAPDGNPADYGVEVAHVVPYRVVVSPSMAATPAAPGVPAALVGQPGTDVFPPVVTEIVPVPTDSSVRLDVVYPGTLFQPCSIASTGMCTASGRIVSTAATGVVPEAGVRVVLESADTGLPISTVAITASDGTFAIRVSDTTIPTRLRLGASASRHAYPTFSMPVGTFDPAAGVDIVVPSLDVVRYVGRVEFHGAPVPDALVRAFATTIVATDASQVVGATFDATVRTTTAASPDGPGFFAIDLVAGAYDLVASDVATDSSLVLQSVTVNLPAGGGSQAGQTFVLGDAMHVAGSVAGPDGRALPYASIEAHPVDPTVVSGSPSVYVRPASTTTDVGGAFDLSVDSGAFDLVFTPPASAGLPVDVYPNVSVASSATAPWLGVTIAPPVVLYGGVQAVDGSVVPHAKVSAFLYVAPTNDRNGTAIPIGDTLADDAGHYRLLLPSAINAP